MYNTDVDASQTVSRRRQADNTEVRNRLSIQLGPELGE